MMSLTAWNLHLSVSLIITQDHSSQYLLERSYDLCEGCTRKYLNCNASFYSALSLGVSKCLLLIIFRQVFKEVLKIMLLQDDMAHSAAATAKSKLKQTPSLSDKCILGSFMCITQHTGHTAFGLKRKMKQKVSHF